MSFNWYRLSNLFFISIKATTYWTSGWYMCSRIGILNSPPPLHLQTFAMEMLYFHAALHLFVFSPHILKVCVVITLGSLWHILSFDYYLFSCCIFPFLCCGTSELAHNHVSSYIVDFHICCITLVLFRVKLWQVMVARGFWPCAYVLSHLLL
jgi:hypothetical protein